MSDLLGQVLYTPPTHVVYAGVPPGEEKENDSNNRGLGKVRGECVRGH